MATKQTKKSKVTPQKSSNPWIAILLGYVIITIISISFYSICKEQSFLQDDTYITMRYVKNFLNGDGLVYNIGEKVEGYTCFLWVMMLAAMSKFFGMNLETGVQTMSLLFGVTSLFATFHLTKEFLSRQSSVFGDSLLKNPIVIGIVSTFPSFVLAMNNSYHFWAVSGMETSLFVTLVVTTFWLFLRKEQLFPYSWQITALLASLTRPEGMYVFALLYAYNFIDTFFSSERNIGTTFSTLLQKEKFFGTMVYVLPMLLYIGFRFSYYGYPFPNTYYAKTGFSMEYLLAGWDYFRGFQVSYMLYGVASAVGLIPLLRIKKEGNNESFRSAILLVAFVVLYSMYIIYVGGDVLAMYRFFLPVLPISLVLLIGAIFEIGERLREKNISFGIPVSIVLCLVATAYMGHANYHEGREEYERKVSLEKGLVEKMKLTGLWLKAKQAEMGRPLILAATTIGALSYYSEVVVIDMIGLTDAEIAHNPKIIPEVSQYNRTGWKERNYNVDYVLSRKPDFVYFSTGLKPSAYAERALFTSEEFRRRYYGYYFQVSSLNFGDALYKRKSDIELAMMMPPKGKNPNYTPAFVHDYNNAFNASRGPDEKTLLGALEHVDKVLKRGPSDFAGIYHLQAEIYNKLKQPEKAVESNKKAIELNPHEVMARYALFQYYMSVKDTLNAQTEIDYIQRFDPDLFK